MSQTNESNTRRISYAVAILLVIAILLAFFLLKLYAIPVPENPGVLLLEIDLRLFVFGIVSGIVADGLFLLSKKPVALAVIAVIAIFGSLLCSGSQFTAIYAFAALCCIGSIPLLAQIAGKIWKKA